jgi:flagellar motor switch protein FliM
MLHDDSSSRAPRDTLNPVKEKQIQPYLNKSKHSESGIKAVIDQSLQSYEKLPMLQIIFDKLVRLLAVSLRNLTSEAVDIEIKTFSSLRFSTWLSKAESPSAIGVFKIIEWNNLGLLVLNNELVFNFIELLLGGKKNAPPSEINSKSYTLIEQSIIKQIIEVIINSLSESFNLVHNSTFTLERLETNPNLTSIARPGDAVILLELAIDLDNRKGTIELVIPYETIEPIKKDLQQVFIGDNNKDDSNWRDKLANTIHGVDLQIEALIVDTNIKFSTISQMKIGDTIMINHKTNDAIPVLCGKKKLFDATIGKKEEQVAIHITNVK